jgi:hypothetical protein
MIAHQSLTCVGYRLPIGFPHSAHLCRRRERTAFTSAADAQIPRNRHNDTSIRSSGSPLATHPYEIATVKCCPPKLMCHQAWLFYELAMPAVLVPLRTPVCIPREIL